MLEFCEFDSEGLVLKGEIIPSLLDKNIEFTGKAAHKEHIGFDFL